MIPQSGILQKHYPLRLHACDTHVRWIPKRTKMDDTNFNCQTDACKKKKLSNLSQTIIIVKLVHINCQIWLSHVHIKLVVNFHFLHGILYIIHTALLHTYQVARLRCEFHTSQLILTLTRPLSIISHLCSAIKDVSHTHHVPMCTWN